MLSDLVIPLGGRSISANISLQQISQTSFNAEVNIPFELQACPVSKFQSFGTVA